MVNQILDRRTIAIPGGKGDTGDVTPELLSARDQAVQARQAADTARNQAEVFAANTVALQDAAMTSVASDAASQFSAVQKTKIEVAVGPVITAATATALAAGSAPTVSFTDQGRNRTIRFGIPVGRDGIPPSLSGTYAARPAANSVPAATIYYPTNVPETYRSDGSVWSVVGAGGNELGYAQLTSQFNTASTTPVDVPGLTVTFVVGERPIMLRLDADMASQGPNGTAVAHIILDGVRLAGPGLNAPPADRWVTISRGVRKGGLVPGSTHVAKIQLQSAATTYSARITGDSTNPASLSVVTL
ncbi:hypothetical protein [Mycetocola saprophilus]|uniref:hypothetical protein n=1 Tax=Mycetocola saprophilus TaxID=76636 RepID=UPI0004C1E350|nr:hypothetical protein [Mycetocola saprophilus]